MTPAQPPPPTNSNLPFQFSGSQTSISIKESEVGLSVAATRQNGGTVNTVGGGAAPPPPPGPCPRPPPRCGAPAAGAAGAAGGGAGAAGGVKTPAGTSSAIVIVVLGMEIDFRPAHGVAASAELKRTRARFAIIFGPPECGKTITDFTGTARIAASLFS